MPALRKYGAYSMDEKTMRRAKCRVEEKAVKDLLAEIDRGLSATDKRLVARQCQTDEYEVQDVLSGYKEDAHMLALLYARAGCELLCDVALRALQERRILTVKKI